MNEKLHIEADICMIMLIMQIETLSFYIIRMKTNITMGFMSTTYIWWTLFSILDIYQLHFILHRIYIFCITQSPWNHISRHLHVNLWKKTVNLDVWHTPIEARTNIASCSNCSLKILWKTRKDLWFYDITGFQTRIRFIFIYVPNWSLDKMKEVGEKRKDHTQWNMISSEPRSRCVG